MQYNIDHLDNVYHQKQIHNAHSQILQNRASHKFVLQLKVHKYPHVEPESVLVLSLFACLLHTFPIDPIDLAHKELDIP
jgi:hypothetical protein